MTNDDQQSGMGMGMGMTSRWGWGRDGDSLVGMGWKRGQPGGDGVGMGIVVMGTGWGWGKQYGDGVGMGMNFFTVSFSTPEEQKFHGSECSTERKFLEPSLLRNESSTRAKVPRSECSMEGKFHGSESSLYGLFAPGNESAEERKGLESAVPPVH